MTKEEIEKEIAKLKADKEYNIRSIAIDRDHIERLVEEFASNAMAWAEFYTDKLIDKLNKLLEAENDERKD